MGKDRDVAGGSAVFFLLFARPNSFSRAKPSVALPCRQRQVLRSSEAFRALVKDDKFHRQTMLSLHPDKLDQLDSSLHGHANTLLDARGRQIRESTTIPV